MSNVYESFWICKGPKQDPHPEEEVEKGELCPRCNLPEQQFQESSSLLWGKIFGGVVLLAFIVGIILTFRFFFSGSNSNQASRGSHKNTRYGISLNYPKSWELRKPSYDHKVNVLTGAKDLFQLVPSDQNNTSYEENILVKIEQVTDNPFLDDYADKQVARINQIGTYKIDEDIPMKVSKEAAREIVYSGNNGQYNLKRKRIIMSPKTPSDYFILVTYTADIYDYEQYLPEVDKVLKSIELLE